VSIIGTRDIRVWCFKLCPSYRFGNLTIYVTMHTIVTSCDVNGVTNVEVDWATYKLANWVAYISSRGLWEGL
jgi:hypothetical protein